LNIKIIEIKARCSDPEKIEKILISLNAYLKGTDHQTDTYFNCSTGRLKLREGNIENSLIHYKRPDQSGPKLSDVNMLKLEAGTKLKSILSDSIGIFKTVIKKRKIFFIENIKIHIDEVKGLGSFVEIEAIDEKGIYTEEQLLEQCSGLMKKLGISDNDLIKTSYSDML